MNDFATMPAPEADALLARARGLQRAARNGGIPQVLRGKNVGLMCDAPDDAEAALFQRAATALGARVSHLRPSLTETSTSQDVRHTASVLGRLYDAIDCVGMAPELIHRIGADAMVPVFEDIGSAGHPTAHWVTLLDHDTAESERRCALIQAVLLSALA